MPHNFITQEFIIMKISQIVSQFQSLTYEEMTALDEDNLAPGRGLDTRGIEQNSLKKKFEAVSFPICSVQIHQ